MVVWGSWNKARSFQLRATDLLYGLNTSRSRLNTGLLRL